MFSITIDSRIPCGTDMVLPSLWIELLMLPSLTLWYDTPNVDDTVTRNRGMILKGSTNNKQKEKNSSYQCIVRAFHVEHQFCPTAMNGFQKHGGGGVICGNYDLGCG